MDSLYAIYYIFHMTLVTLCKDDSLFQAGQLRPEVPVHLSAWGLLSDAEATGGLSAQASGHRA